MTTTATKTVEQEENIAIVIDYIRPHHSSCDQEDFNVKLAQELGRLEPETVSALADAFVVSVPIIAV